MPILWHGHRVKKITPAVLNIPHALISARALTVPHQSPPSLSDRLNRRNLILQEHIPRISFFKFKFLFLPMEEIDFDFIERERGWVHICLTKTWPCQLPAWRRFIKVVCWTAGWTVYHDGRGENIFPKWLGL